MLDSVKSRLLANMGIICSFEHDLLASAYVDLVRDVEKLVNAVDVQEVEIVAQKGKFTHIPHSLKSLLFKENPDLDLEAELNATLTRCLTMRRVLGGIRKRAEKQEDSVSVLKKELLPVKSELEQVHAHLKKTRKMIKKLSSVGDEDMGEDAGRRVVTEGEYEARLADLERRLQERERMIEELQAERQTRRLSSVQLSRHYSDISSDSEMDMHSPTYLEPPKPTHFLRVSELQIDLSRLASYNQKLLKEKILLMFCSSLQMNMVRAMHLWRHATRGRATSSNFDLSYDRKSSVDQDEWSRKSVGSRGFGEMDKTAAKPMSRTNAILLFESVLDDKHEQDLKDLSLNRTPKSPGEFLVEYLNRRHGLANLAMAKLTQFAMGVAKMQRSGSQYANLISGLFGFGEEMHSSLSLFIPHARALFLRVRDKKRTRTAFTSSSPGGKAEDIESGGTAPLVAVCDLIYSLCGNFPLCGETMLKWIRPSEVSVEDFVIMKVCQKMAQDGCSPEAMFRKLDCDDSGTITSQEFEEGLRSLMGLWLTSSDLRTAMEKISRGRSEIAREDFFSCINFDVYFCSEAGKNLKVTCCTFLKAFQTLYDELVQKCRDAFTLSCTSTEMQRSEFFTALRLLDPSLTDSDIEMLYEKVSGPLDVSEFLEVCQNEYVGQLKMMGNG